MNLPHSPIAAHPAAAAHVAAAHAAAAQHALTRAAAAEHAPAAHEAAARSETGRQAQGSHATRAEGRQAATSRTAPRAGRLRVAPLLERRRGQQPRNAAGRLTRRNAAGLNDECVKHSRLMSQTRAVPVGGGSSRCQILANGSFDERQIRRD